MQKLHRAVFLDRDGTLIRDAHYLNSIDGVQLYKGVARALAALKKAHFKLIVISNQSGIGRGIVSQGMVDAINEHLQGVLKKAAHVRLDGFYYCPHKPEDNCLCRKPKTGLIKQVCREIPIDIAKSFFIGDKACDIFLARRLRVPGLLVLTGHGKKELEKFKSLKKVKRFSSFREAAQWILEQNFLN